MRTPKYTITNLILNYIVKYELAVERIKIKKFPQRHLNEIYEKLRAENIDKLGELIAYPIGYNKSLQIQRGEILSSQKTKLQIFANYRSATDFLKKYSGKDDFLPSWDLVEHLNRILMKGVVDEWDVGKIRGYSEKPNEIFDTWYKMRDFYPTVNTTTHFNEYFRWIREEGNSVHKLIKIGMTIFEFIDKAPVYAGNQITTILILEALTKEYGYNPYNTIPFAKSINLINEDLLSAFKMAKAKRDLTIFLEAFLYTISLSAVEVSREYSNTYENKTLITRPMEKDLNPRQIKVVEYLLENGKITRQTYAKMMGMSFMTAYRDLLELVDKDFIENRGQGRGTYYVLKEKEKK